MERYLEYQIPQQMEGHKISEFLHSKGYSNQNLAIIKRMPESILIWNQADVKIEDCKEEKNRITSSVKKEEARWERMNYILCAGDVLAVHIQEEKNSPKIPPVALSFPIVYEDEDIVVINKPAGMPIHPSAQNYENTLGNAAAFYYQSQKKAFIYRCVNRLDKDTTGLTILAKHLVSSSILYNSIVRHEIHREYIAIVEGNLISNQGIIDIPIGRKEESAIERMVDIKSGERAVTHYQVLDRQEDTSVVKLHLDTGRTHQIRVHMAYIGHPLIGDFLYNPENHQMKRQALHAYHISFPHPITGTNIELFAPIPEDMRSYVREDKIL